MNEKKQVSVLHQIGTKFGRRSRDNLPKLVNTLTLSMRAKLKFLTSRRRKAHLAAKRMDLILMQQRFIVKSNRRSSKYKVFKVKVDLITDKRERPFIHFWHELPKRLMRLKIIQAFHKVQSLPIFKSYKIAILKASKFDTIRIANWSFSGDETLKQKLERANLPLDPYLPMTEDQTRIVDCLPILKIPSSSIEILHNLLYIENVKGKKLRQTKIEEFFKP